MEAWRILKNKHAAGAFSGEGAYRYGGRWNSPGTRLVYASQSLSLAALEVLVHLPVDAQVIFSTFRLSFDDRMVEFFATNHLPLNWRAEPPGPDTQIIGDEWVRDARTAILAVPSAIIPAETNFLLNPVHTDFPKIEIGLAQPFTFDSRLLKIST